MNSSGHNVRVPKERSSNNVTNLEEVRQARALAQAQPADVAEVDADGFVDDMPKADAHGNRRFDAEKVARIKAEIAAGEYKINPSRIADKFIEHDRNQ